VQSDEIVAAAAIVGANAVVHKVLPESLHIPANLAVAGFVTGLAVRGGADADDLGLAPGSLGAGVRTGAVAAAAIASGIVAATRVERTQHLFHDERVGGYSRGRTAYELALRIPLGTALAEELLFRAALPALLARNHSRASAVVVSNLAFGVWHVVPTLESLETSNAATRLPGHIGARLAAVAGVAAVTAAAGFGLAALQRRSRSVIAPIIAHTALNVATFAGARAVMSAT
jgi:membrane protease YdiL (CAAX protease family)